MKKSFLAGVFTVIAAYASGSIAHAGTLIPYPSPCTVSPENYSFTATATGDIIGYLYSANAADVDQIAMSVNGGPLSPYGIGNTNPVGTQFDFGHVTVGDTLTFVLQNTTEVAQFSSNAASNADGLQHVYSVAYTNPGPFAVTGIPSGTYVAFEDRLGAPFNAGISPPSDFDYNDELFVFTNVSIGETPLPPALPLFASALGTLGLLGWRRKRKAAAVV